MLEKYIPLLWLVACLLTQGLQLDVSRVLSDLRNHYKKATAMCTNAVMQIRCMQKPQHKASKSLLRITLGIQCTEDEIPKASNNCQKAAILAEHNPCAVIIYKVESRQGFTHNHRLHPARAERTGRRALSSIAAHIGLSKGFEN